METRSVYRLICDTNTEEFDSEIASCVDGDSVGKKASSSRKSSRDSSGISSSDDRRTPNPTSPGVNSSMSFGDDLILVSDADAGAPTNAGADSADG